MRSGKTPAYVCGGDTGVMTAIYRITDDAWTADQAFAEMKQYKFGFDFLHPEFKRFVYTYRPELARASVTKAVAATKTAS